MTLLLPNLDDRRWTDLVDEAKTLIPLYAPEWTDHNVHDPGITLVELLAWIAEMDIYRLNRMPDERRRKLSSLIGVTPDPPRAARTVVEFNIDKAPAGTPPTFVVEAGSELEAVQEPRDRLAFRTIRHLTVVPSAITVLQREVAGSIEDITQELVDYRKPILPWGPEPKRGAALYVGLTKPLPRRRWSSFYIVVPESVCNTLTTDVYGAMRIAPHHSARVVWEYLDHAGTWYSLAPERIQDETRALTRSGRVRLRVDGKMGAQQLGESSEQYYYVRCRLVTPVYDAAPELRSVLLNAVEAEQSRVTTITHTLEKSPAGGLPVPGLEVPHIPLVDGGKVQVRTEIDAATGGTKVRRWRQREDFLASEKYDAHVVVDPLRSLLTFGDGNRGRAVPLGATIKASYRATEGSLGNAELKVSGQWAKTERKSSRNNFAALVANVRVTFPLPATGGSSGESFAQTINRAVRSVENPQRCVTLQDFERLAMKTPGVRLARTKAIANLHPDHLYFEAPGVVTLLVLPFLPTDHPVPSPGLLRALSSFLAPRRILGTRVEVVGPRYVEVAVRAQLRAFAKADPQRVAADVEKSINTFFHPLRGGPNGKGWPFGRDVYRSEVLQILDESPGVDHVLALEFVDSSGETSCGNVCLPLTALVSAGNHEIEVVV